MLIGHTLANDETPSCTYSSQTYSQTCNLNKGLVFIKERDILLSTDLWTLIVSVGTEDYDEVLSDVETLFSYLDSQRNTSEISDLIPYLEFLVSVNHS